MRSHLFWIVFICIVVLLVSCKKDTELIDNQPDREIVNCLEEVAQWQPGFKDSLHWEKQEELLPLGEDWLTFIKKRDNEYYRPFELEERQRLDELINLLETENNPAFLLVYAKALRIRANQFSIEESYERSLVDTERANQLYIPRVKFLTTKYDSIELADILNGMAGTLQKTRAIGSSINASKEAEALYRKFGLLRDLASEYSNLGATYAYGADIKNALFYAQKATCIWDAIWPSVSSPSGDDFLNYLGVSFNLGNYHLVQADQLQDKAFLNSANTAYWNAINQFQKVIRNIKEVDSNNLGPFFYTSISTANAFLRKAELHTNDVDSSLFFVNMLSDSLTKFFQTDSENLPPPIISRINMVSAIYYARKGDLEKARTLSDAALAAAAPALSNPGNVNTMQTTQVQDKLLYLQTLYMRGVFFDICYSKTNDVEDLRLALDVYENALLLLKKMRVNFADDTSVEAIANRQHILFSKAAYAAYRLYENDIKSGKNIDPADINNFLDRSLRIADEGKSFSLRFAAYRSLAALGSKGKNQQLVQEEIRLRDLIRKYAESDNNNRLVDAQNSYNKFIDRLQTSENSQDYAYYLSRFEERTPTIKEIQTNWLGDNSAIVQYELDREHALVYLITKNDASIQSFTIDSALFDLIAAYKQDIEVTGTGAYFGRNSFQLYQRIFEKADNWLSSRKIENLLIIPDRELSNVIFSGLLRKKADYSSQWPEAEFLLDKYAISYAFSLGSYDAMLKLNAFQDKKTAPFAAFIANPESKNKTNSPLATLDCDPNPLTTLENATIKISQDVYDTKSINPATEYKFKELAPQFNILQVSAHGCFDLLNNPMDNYIQLFSGEGEDGNLTVREIYELPLNNVKLTVLSNCLSGQGITDAGEGLKSIARAFIYAGSEGIVASMKKIEVDFTAELLKSFYQYLSDGFPPHRALWKAKIDFKKERVDPAQWANYTFIGNLNLSLD